MQQLSNRRVTLPNHGGSSSPHAK